MEWKGAVVAEERGSEPGTGAGVDIESVGKARPVLNLNCKRLPYRMQHSAAVCPQRSGWGGGIPARYRACVNVARTGVGRQVGGGVGVVGEC